MMTTWGREGGAKAGAIIILKATPTTNAAARGTNRMGPALLIAVFRADAMVAVMAFLPPRAR
jgi:hypothetical protein